MRCRVTRTRVRGTDEAKIHARRSADAERRARCAGWRLAPGRSRPSPPASALPARRRATAGIAASASLIPAWRGRVEQLVEAAVQSRIVGTGGRKAHARGARPRGLAQPGRRSGARSARRAPACRPRPARARRCTRRRRRPRRMPRSGGRSGRSARGGPRHPARRRARSGARLRAAAWTSGREARWRRHRAGRLSDPLALADLDQDVAATGLEAQLALGRGPIVQLGAVEQDDRLDRRGPRPGARRSGPHRLRGRALPARARRRTDACGEAAPCRRRAATSPGGTRPAAPVERRAGSSRS